MQQKKGRERVIPGYEDRVFRCYTKDEVGAKLLISS